MSNESQPTRLALISLILPALILLTWCVYFIAAFAVIGGAGGTENETLGYAVFLGGTTLGIIVTILLALAGLIVGVVALRKKDARRGMALAGVVVNLLCILPYLAALIFTLTMGATQ